MWVNKESGEVVKVFGNSRNEQGESIIIFQCDNRLFNLKASQFVELYEYRRV